MPHKRKLQSGQCHMMRYDDVCYKISDFNIRKPHIYNNILDNSGIRISFNDQKVC